MIEFAPPLCRIHDLNSNNGTHVNGEQVATSFLHHDDTVRIGRSVLRVELVPPSEDETVDFPVEGTDLMPLPRVDPKRASAIRPVCPICQHSKHSPKDSLCATCQESADRIEQTVPGYRLIREVGSGGLGVVYLALHEKDRRPVAVKLIEAAPSATPKQISGFLKGAEVLTRLRHRHLVSLQDGAAIGKSIYLVTDFVAGADAMKLLQRGPLSVEAAARVVCQLLSALKYAHARRLVHRDIKPANVLVRIARDRNTVKVADFGLARLYQDSGIGGKTLPGDMTGTTAFMAPERVLDFRSATQAADQYSAAAVLYYLLTGELVYDQPQGVPAQLAQILDDEVVPIRDRRAGLPAKLISMVHRGLSRDPARRFPDVEAFKKALLPFGAE